MSVVISRVFQHMSAGAIAQCRDSYDLNVMGLLGVPLCTSLCAKEMASPDWRAYA